MDDLAHLLLGYILYRFARIAGAKDDRLALAAFLAGSILPDPLWFFGITSYEASHTATWYVLAAIPFLLFARTRLPAAGFAVSATLHVLVDSVMHARTTVPFAPFLQFSITGTFNYWEQPWSIVAYWLALLLLLGLSFWLEKRKNAAKPAPKSS
jgi:hypothetical protein